MFSPEINFAKFTEEEDLIIQKLVCNIGPK